METAQRVEALITAMPPPLEMSGVCAPAGTWSSARGARVAYRDTISSVRPQSVCSVQAHVRSPGHRASLADVPDLPHDPAQERLGLHVHDPGRRGE